MDNKEKLAILKEKGSKYLAAIIIMQQFDMAFMSIMEEIASLPHIDYAMSERIKLMELDFVKNTSDDAIYNTIFKPNNIKNDTFKYAHLHITNAFAASCAYNRIKSILINFYDMKSNPNDFVQKEIFIIEDYDKLTELETFKTVYKLNTTDEAYEAIQEITFRYIMSLVGYIISSQEQPFIFIVYNFEIMYKSYFHTNKDVINAMSNITKMLVYIALLSYIESSYPEQFYEFAMRDDNGKLTNVAETEDENYFGVLHFVDGNYDYMEEVITQLLNY